jgi:CrcB protein
MQGMIFVGVGGVVGALCRYGLGTLVQRLVGGAFPLGTMLVNLLGCLFIGFLAGLQEARQMLSPEWALFVFVGFLGSFTTFSTLGLDAFKLLREEAIAAAGLYVGGQVIVGVLAVFGGFALSRLL